MKLTIVSLAAVVLCANAYAQQDSTQKTLDEIIVTATKTTIKQSQTGKVVSVISQQTLQRNAGKTISEILNNEAGMFVIGGNGPLGTNQDLYLRGAATGNTLILVDGIPAGDPSYINNSFDLNSLNPQQVERIEILKGAQSTLWGSDAVAGVINIITKKGGDKAFTPSAMLTYGSYQTIAAKAGIGGIFDKYTYNINYGYLKSRGFSSAYDSTGNAGFDRDGFSERNLQVNLGYTITKSLHFSAYGNYANSHTDLDNSAFTDDRDYTASNTNAMNSLALDYNSKKTALHLSNTFITARRNSRNDSSADSKNGDLYLAGFTGKSMVSELYGNFKFTPVLSLTAGAQRVHQNTDQFNSGYSRDYNYGYASAINHDSAKTNNYAVYASLLLVDVHHFNAEAGARVNFHNLYGNNATYSFNPSYTIGTNTKVFLNLSSAFKVPSLYQLYSEYGNTSLKPEKTNNIELGFQQFFDDKQSSVRVTGFKRDGKQVIVFYTDPVTYAGRYINRDAQHDYGAELESKISMGRWGSWVNNVTYIKGEGKNDGQKVKNLYRRPDFSINSAFTIQFCKHLTLMPSFRLIGTRLKGEYDAGPEKLPQYYTVDFYASYAFVKKLRAFANLKNLTNQLYFDVPGYNSRKANYTVGVSWGE